MSVNDVPCKRCLVLMELIEKLSVSFAHSCQMLREANERLFNETDEKKKAARVAEVHIHGG